MITTTTTADQLFGTRPADGSHSHPATHPLWMIFTTANCPVCGHQAAATTVKG